MLIGAPDFGPVTTAKRLFQVGMEISQDSCHLFDASGSGSLPAHLGGDASRLRYSNPPASWHLPDFDRVPGAPAMHAAGLGQGVRWRSIRAGGRRPGGLQRFNLHFDQQGTSGFLGRDQRRAGWATRRIWGRGA